MAPDTYVDPITILFAFYTFNLFPLTTGVMALLIATISHFSEVRLSTVLKLSVSVGFLFLMISVGISSIYTSYPPSTLFWFVVVVGVVPAALIGWYIWKRLQAHLIITVAALGIITLIFLFFYPKPHHYFSYSSISQPVLLNEIFKGLNDDETFPESVRVVDKVLCECIGIEFGNTFGEYPFQYGLCMGLPQSCEHVETDICPHEPPDTMCTIIRTAEI